MGSSSSKKQPPVIATCKAPMYCIKKLGGRHILLGGGGGAAKTGVKNQIEQHVLTFAEEAVNNCYMRTKLTYTIDTEKFSTMNMDIVSIPGKIGHILAAGHDEYCDIYETTNNFAEEGSFGINLRLVGRLLTVLAEKSSAANSEPAYQKCVRFDKSSHGKKLLTGDSDGYIRVWDIDHLRNDRNPELKRSATLEFYAHPGTNDRREKGGVDDIDISSDGRYSFSVGGDNKVILWDLTVGKKVQELPFPPELETGYRVRSLKFTRLGLEGNNHIFVVAYNSKQRNSKSRCFLGLWAFHRERHTLQPIVIKSCYQGESISCLTVSPCGNFTGFGTLSGSVAIFDTHELKPLLFVKETHGIFVTDVEFLDRVVDDCQMTDANNKQIEIPGPAADCRACLVSLSADQTVQVHRLAFEQPPSSTLFLVKLMIFLNIIYYLIWTLAGY